MPKGGARRGAGRPYGSVNKRHKVEVDDPTALMPVEWMLAVLRDPEAEQSRRDRMAEVAAPYLHSRLATVGISGTGIAPGGDTYISQIFAVPRGGTVDVREGTITVDGAAISPAPVNPYEGTPAITNQLQSTPPAPLPVIDVATDNITRLDTFKRERDEPSA